MADSVPPPAGIADADLQKLQVDLDKARIQAEIRKLASSSESDRAAAEARNAASIAEDRRKAFLSSLPPTEAKALEGNLTIDDKVLIENSTLAYNALHKVGAQIAKAVVMASNTAPILIHSSQDIGALAAYDAFIEQMELLTTSFNEIEPMAAAPVFGALAAPVVATAAVKSVIDLLALFRSDVDIKGTFITVDELALTTEVAGELAKTNPVFVPQLLPVRAVDNHGGGWKVQGAILGVRRAADGAEGRATLQQSHDRLTELRAILDLYLKALESTLNDPETSLMARLVRGESLSTRLGKNAMVLYLKVVAAGGSNRVTRTLFFGSDLKHSGGVIVNYILMRLDGSVIKSGMFSSYSGYRDVVVGGV